MIESKTDKVVNPKRLFQAWDDMEQRLTNPIVPKENSTRAQNFKQGKYLVVVVVVLVVVMVVVAVVVIWVVELVVMVVVAVVLLLLFLLFFRLLLLQ